MPHLKASYAKYQNDPNVAAFTSDSGRGNLNIDLKPREFEVYELLCAGLSNRQIGECLFISEETAKAHAHHIFDKLGIRSRQALAIDAARRRAGHPRETS